MRGKWAIAATVALAAAFAGAPGAAAGEADLRSPLCQSAWVGTQWVGGYCIQTDIMLSPLGTASVYAKVDACAYDPSICRSGRPVFVGSTGFEPDPAMPLPGVYPGPSVKFPGGRIGWLWVNGTRSPVMVTSVCVGVRPYCP